MAAIHSAKAGSPPLLLERSPDGGRKILISGGGRCNVLPSALDPRQYTTASSPHTLRRMLLSWPLEEQRSFFEVELGIPLVLEPESGKLFPVSNRAREVRDALVARALQLGTEPLFHRSLRELQPLGPGSEGEYGGWRLGLSDGSVLHAERVILATGGLSVPATGSDGTGLRVAQALGHTLRETYPALTPLLALPPVHASLAGVSLEVTLEARPIPGSPDGEGRKGGRPPAGGSLRSRGGFLFTHRGYSGPAVLDLSHLRAQGYELRVRWTHEEPSAWDERLRNSGGGSVGPLLRRALPTRLADQLLREAGIEGDRSLAQLRREERGRLAELLGAYPLPVQGDEGYRKAEVTGGGVALEEVDPRTLESRRQPGLFLCGELLDAFGPIGGYNFAWAWATGRLAGLGAAARSFGPTPSMDSANHHL